MKKIMFICTENICRSAMADGLMKKKAEEENLEIEVYSSGIHAETGDAASYNAIAVMKDYGVDISNHKATNTRESNIRDMDLILCATMGHKNILLQMYPELSDKIFTMKEYVGNADKDISDPWGYDMFVYEKCAKEIYDCVVKIIDKEKNIG